MESIHLNSVRLRAPEVVQTSEGSERKPPRGKVRVSGSTAAPPLILYGIHLIDGTIFEVLEALSAVTETLPEKIAAHRDEDLLCAGDPFNGFNFIPRRSILYVSQTEVQRIEDVICPFRVFNTSLPS